MRRTNTVPTKKFFLKCDPAARYFYAVEVHPTKKSMLQAIKDLGGTNNHARDSRAVCLRFELKDPHPKHEQIGTIFFQAKDCGPEVVVHELTHAACGWARRVGIQPINAPKRIRYENDPEERFASCLGFLVRQMYPGKTL